MFTLELRLAGSKLTATLRNRSKTTQQFFHHSMIQPVTLTLVDAQGHTLPPEDTREIAKFDATPYKDLYQTLEPGAAVTPLMAPISTGALRWGPLSWTDLPPGRYTATANFSHAINQWVDRQTKLSGVYPDLWHGLLVSPPVSLKIP